jgi:hypothetical protein
MSLKDLFIHYSIRFIILTVFSTLFISGFYFSHFPAVSLCYGTLILCRVMPGRVEELDKVQAALATVQTIGNDFDSRRVVGFGKPEDDSGFSIIHLVKNASQILPLCVIQVEEKPMPIVATPQIPSITYYGTPTS